MSTALATREPRVRRSWLEPFTALQDEFGELASSFFGDVGRAWPRGLLTPSLDLSETENEIEARLDLPGIKPEEFDIQLSDNTLTVSGQRKEEKEEKGKTYHRVERRHGSFSRMVTLPCAVDPDKVEAQYKDGVLAIKMPKTEEAKARKIKVRT